MGEGQFPALIRTADSVHAGHGGRLREEAAFGQTAGRWAEASNEMGAAGTLPTMPRGHPRRSAGLIPRRSGTRFRKFAPPDCIQSGVPRYRLARAFQ